MQCHGDRHHASDCTNSIRLWFRPSAEAADINHSIPLRTVGTTRPPWQQITIIVIMSCLDFPPTGKCTYHISTQYPQPAPQLLRRIVVFSNNEPGAYICFSEPQYLATGTDRTQQQQYQQTNLPPRLPPRCDGWDKQPLRPRARVI